ncbi:MAG TPA: CHAT domain-containing protein [Leptolyngbyaceae cyanobacterium]
MKHIKRYLALFLSTLILVIFLNWFLADSGISQERLILGSQVNILNIKQEKINRNLDVERQQLLEKGKSFYEAEQFLDALKVWQEAEKYFDAQQDLFNQALTLNFISLTQQKLGNWSEAESAIASSLSLLQKSENTGQERWQILANAFNTQGRLQLSTGQPEAALASLQQATAAYQKAGDEEGRIGSLLNQAQAMQSLGLYIKANKTLIEGLKLDGSELEYANKLAERLKNIQNQPDSGLKATRLIAIGNGLYLVGDLASSQKFAEESLVVAKRLNSARIIGEAYLNLGNINLSIAKRIENLEEYVEESDEFKQARQAALKYYQQAADLSSIGNIRLQAQLNLFNLLISIKQFSEAEKLLPQIQSQINLLPSSHTKIIAKVNFSRALIKMSLTRDGELTSQTAQMTKDIAKMLANSVQEAKTLADKRAESFALGNLAELYERNQQFSDGEELTKQALILAQSLNAPDIAYRWQWQLGRLLKAQGKLESAIAFYTEAVNTLQSIRTDLAAINPDIQFSFRDSVEPVYRQLVDLLLESVKQQESEPQKQTRLAQARKTIESLQLAELDNFFREACLDAQPKQIDQIDRKAAVIYPVILPDRLEIILTLPDRSLSNYTIYINQIQVESTINQLRQDLAIRHANQQERLRLSQQVYDWLIKPIEAELKSSSVQTLVFVLDGALRNIPMAALYNGEQYLIEQYSIAIAPGLQLLKPQPLTRVNLRALAGGVSESRQGFSPLPGVRKELEEINVIVPGIRLLNQQFTTTSLENEVKQVPFPVVHLATHGQFSSQLENTFILAWDREINVKQLDELLRNRNPNELDPIELLVLSACETATGDKRAALGLAGVAVKAGARSTLATLWKVSDDSTSALMTEFYKQLANKQITKAEALRLAQLNLLKDRSYRIPYFWAPYVLVGNWL